MPLFPLPCRCGPPSRSVSKNVTRRPGAPKPMGVSADAPSSHGWSRRISEAPGRPAPGSLSPAVPLKTSCSTPISLADCYKKQISPIGRAVFEGQAVIAPRSGFFLTRRTPRTAETQRTSLQPRRRPPRQKSPASISTARERTRQAAESAAARAPKSRGAHSLPFRLWCVSDYVPWCGQ